MRERIWIGAGLLLFVAVMTTPFWSAHGAATLTAKRGGGPNLVLPASATQCVAPVSYMRAAHMRLLLRWREEVVRHNQRRYVAFNGKVYDKSLTGTCLGCHNKEQFCDRCHAYAGVSAPSCWGCHSAPQTQLARNTP